MWLAATDAVLALIYLINGVLKLPSQPTKSLVLGDYEVLTHEQGREDEFDISNDGRWLTYVNKGPKKYK